MMGAKISLGTAARGAALDGGSAAAARRVVWRRCGRAGLCSFSSFARTALGLFATDTKTTSSEPEREGECLVYGCVGDRWWRRFARTLASNASGLN